MSIDQNMATGNTKQKLCETCDENKTKSQCLGCSRTFCKLHFGEHQQDLMRQLDPTAEDRNLFHEKLNQQGTNLQKQVFEQVNRWERESIEKIKQKAEEIGRHICQDIEERVLLSRDGSNQLNRQLKQCKNEDNIMEDDLQRLKEEL